MSGLVVVSLVLWPAAAAFVSALTGSPVNLLGSPARGLRRGSWSAVTLRLVVFHAAYGKKRTLGLFVLQVLWRAREIFVAPIYDVLWYKALKYDFTAAGFKPKTQWVFLGFQN